MEDINSKLIMKLPLEVKDKLKNVPDDILSSMEEIRINSGKDTLIIGNGKEYNLDDKKNITPIFLEDILNRLLKYSYYAYEDELSNGYISIEGGHRVGICGKTVIKNGKVSLIKNITSLNIRRSKEVIGSSDIIKNHIYNSEKRSVSNTLIISPPKCGKTTILRDITRTLSNIGFRISVCDERSEIAGCYDGGYNYDLGIRTDVLDGCPKAQGIPMLIRAMSPEIVVTDEIGKKEDVDAIEFAICAGVNIITTIHGRTYNDVKNSSVGVLVDNNVFKTLIFLTDEPATGTVKGVIHV